MRIKRSRLVEGAFLVSFAMLLPTTSAQSAGSIVDAGDTLVSAMMMFIGNDQKIYILDKAESNAQQVDGHAAWGSVYDIASQQSSVMSVLTNTFCASGMHLPNGSYVTFGGNSAVTTGGNSVGEFDPVIGDFDGRKSIRVLNPCTGDATSWGDSCQWYDNATFLAMQKQRWYSAAEPMGDGTVAIIGGMVSGGYINRNTPNTDPASEGGGAEPTYEFYPSLGEATTMQFMITTSGLNAYAHTFLMASGKMLVQANYSTILWEPLTNAETALPDMPNQVIRVYPASGATAMLPMTPANNYSQTVLFCGGSTMAPDQWGNYSFPAVDTWDIPASNDCQRLTPEPSDGSSVTYEQDDDMLEGRTMGQFIALPDGTLLVVNGGKNGTAGYSQATGETPSFADMPFDESLASDPAFTPAIYNPKAAKGSRWSNAGLSASTIPRLYHSSALLLPDGSVIIAGSNPNIDVNTTAIFPTTYKAEIFFPSYWSSSRPQPTGVPSNLSYGGDFFNITVPQASYSGSANSAAANTSVWVIRQGFTTHAMNMGQRSMQLNNSYTVNSDGSYTLHVNQPPPNANLFQPGPCFIFVTVNGIPSNGTYAIIGNGQLGTQPTADQAVLPASQQPNSDVNGSGDSTNSDSGDSSSSSHAGAVVGGIVGAIVAVGLIGSGLFVWRNRRRQSAALAGRTSPSAYGVGAGALGGRDIKVMRTSDPYTPYGARGEGATSDTRALGVPGRMRNANESDATMIPLATNSSAIWGAQSRSDFRSPSPYRDYQGRASESTEFDPYVQPQQPVRYGERF